MNRCVRVTLWGGPEDGAAVILPPGEWPMRLGVHRTTVGDLVPIRGHALTLELPHLPVYERLSIDVLRMWRTAVGPHGQLFDPGGAQRPEQVPLYLWSPLVTYWAARGA